MVTPRQDNNQGLRNEPVPERTTAGSEPRRTMKVEDWAKLLGVSRCLAYEQARLTGEVGGVRVIRVGRRMLIPVEAAERVLAGE